MFVLIGLGELLELVRTLYLIFSEFKRRLPLHRNFLESTLLQCNLELGTWKSGISMDSHIVQWSPNSKRRSLFTCFLVSGICSFWVGIGVGDLLGLFLEDSVVVQWSPAGSPRSSLLASLPFPVSESSAPVLSSRLFLIHRHFSKNHLLDVEWDLRNNCFIILFCSYWTGWCGFPWPGMESIFIIAVWKNEIYFWIHGCRFQRWSQFH